MIRWCRCRARFAVLLVLLVVGPMAGIARAGVTVPGDYPSIQSAINAVISGAAPDGTTINIQPGTYAELLNISNTAKSLTLRAAGTPGSVVVDATGKGDAPLFILNASGHLVINGITFRHGSRFVGGGFVIQQSSPTLSNCVFELNSANFGGGGALITSNATFNACTIRNNTSTGTGGGVIIEAGARPVFVGCTITGNIAGTTDFDGVGGGVESLDSSPTFRGSHINNNSSKFAAGGIYHAGTFGSSNGTATLVVEDTEIADNVTAPFSASYNPADGGGIHIEDNAVAQLTRVRVLRNKANSGGGLSSYRAQYDIVDTVIDSNQANARTDGGPDGGIGGAVEAMSTNVSSPPRPASVVNLTRSLVRRNSSLTGGGLVVQGDVALGISATLTLNGSVVDSNTTQGQGGGILLSRANMTANNSMVIRNVVSGSGGAVFGGGVLVGTVSNASLTTTTVAHNTAFLGGGLFLDGTAALTMNGSNVYDNAAVGSLARGSGIFVGGSGTQSGSVQNSIVADNTDQLSHSEIHEEACSSITYTNNTLTPAPQFSGCAVGGRASGNNTNTPQFAHFLAVPGAGTASTLVWSVARATSVTIAGQAPSNQATGSVDVTPTSSTTYSLTASTPSGPVGPLNASFTVVFPPTGKSHTVDSDFDGDGKADVTVFRPSTGVWWIRNVGAGNWGAPSDVPVRGDFDGDGKADLAVYRPSAGVWYIVNSSNSTWTTTFWGASSDIAVPGDYDGDGKTDVAIFRPSTGTWWILFSSTSSSSSTVFGGPGDIPVPADYDGDGKTDIALYRPSEGRWYIIQSSNSAITTKYWGASGDLPVPGDYDGDGHADVAIYRPSSGTWYIVDSGGGTTTVTWGISTDVPVPGDFDGDGATDIAVYRPSTGTWFIIQSSTGTPVAVSWGVSTDVPLLKRP